MSQRDSLEIAGLIEDIKGDMLILSAKYDAAINLLEQLEATTSDGNTADKIRKFLIKNKIWPNSQS